MGDHSHFSQLGHRLWLIFFKTASDWCGEREEIFAGKKKNQGLSELMIFYFIVNKFFDSVEQDPKPAEGYEASLLI